MHKFFNLPRTHDVIIQDSCYLGTHVKMPKQAGIPFQDRCMTTCLTKWNEINGKLIHDNNKCLLLF